MLGWPVDSADDLDGATALLKSAVLHALLMAVQVLVSDVGLLFVIQGGRFDYGQLYQVYHPGLKVYSNDDACIEWLQYVDSIGEALDIPARPVKSAKWNVDDVEVKSFVRFVPV